MYPPKANGAIGPRPEGHAVYEYRKSHGEATIAYIHAHYLATNQQP
jgi:hypothetical protein